MEIVLHAKKRSRIGDVGRGTLVSFDEMICIVVNSGSIITQVESYITDNFNFFDFGRVAVVDLKTGNIYLVPEDEECEVITNYNFEVNNL